MIWGLYLFIYTVQCSILIDLLSRVQYYTYTLFYDKIINHQLVRLHTNNHETITYKAIVGLPYHKPHRPSEKP